MAQVHRWIAPLFVAALSAASLVATAGEWTPVQPTAATAADAAPQSARVIVKYKAGSGMAKALSATTGGARVPQHAQTLGTRLGLALVDGRGMDSQTQIVHASGLSSAALAQRLAQDADVEWAVPDRRVRARMLPNDPRFALGQASPYPEAGQWYLRAPQTLTLSGVTGTITTTSAINAVGAWDTTLGAGQVVAVLDTGITPHEDLPSARFLSGYNMVSLNTSADGADAAGKCITGNGKCRGVAGVDTSGADPGDWVSVADQQAHPTLFDNSCLTQTSTGAYVDSPSSWHGTQVSGIVAAETNNSIGVAGIASAAKVLPVRVLGKCGGWDSDIIDGMRWAAGMAVTGVPANANPAKVINLSLGGTGACGTAYQSAVNDVVALGVVVVVAAGNDGLAVGAPGNCSGVVTVAGVRHFGTKVGYSSLGPEVSLAAPAGNCVNTSGACVMPILTTLNDGATTRGNAIYSNALSHISLGTSFATPQVAGTAALMLAVNPQLSSAQVTALLKSSARKPFPSSGAPAGSGAGPGGVVQACKAPSSVAQTSECYCTTTTCGAGMLDAAAAVTAAAGTVTVGFTASPASPQAGQSVSLASNVNTPAGRTIKSYLWELTAGGNLASLSSATNAATATLATTAAGSVTVQLTVTDDLSRSVVASKVLTVAAASTPTPVPTPTQSGGGGGGAWSPAWSLGLLLAALALPGRTLRRR